MLSKLTTMALSWPGRITVLMKSVAASCWKRKRSRMLLLVSIRIADAQRQIGLRRELQNALRLLGFENLKIVLVQIA